MSKKPVISETPANLQIALKKYVKSEITDLKKMVKDAVAEAMAALGAGDEGVNIQELLKRELKGDPNDIDTRDTYIDAADGTFNPAAENTQKKMSQEKMAEVGYVDPDAAKRKEYFRKKNGG